MSETHAHEARLSDTPHWRAFLDTLRAERESSVTPRPLRALADEFAQSTLALLLPQFAEPARLGAQGVDEEASRVESLLAAALTVVKPDAHDIIPAFLERLPAVRTLMLSDARAITAGDPAAESEEEVIISYPGFLASAVHRISHELYVLGVPIFPRVLSEWAHRATGVDIHPGATIGSGFAIDHGTGIVIGETSEIGARVRLYQGVTLGALAVRKGLAHKKRHPTIGDDVVIYANATILGGSTVVGTGSIIGGNVWLTRSVPPRSVVQFSSDVVQRDDSDDGIEFHI